MVPRLLHRASVRFIACFSGSQRPRFSAGPESRLQIAPRGSAMSWLTGLAEVGQNCLLSCES